jgi:putative nucleotidyltransferase with HDIG domain
MKINPKKTDIKKIISHIRDLPTLPRTLLRITTLVNDPKTSARDLSGVITDDQILTARLLKLVNSSFYGFPRKIATVTNAIVLLGFDAIRNLLLTTSIFSLFSSQQTTRPISLDTYWDHSLGCAIGAKIIGKYIKYEKMEELFVAGLLHDIGKIVEVRFLPEEFEKITLLTENEGFLIVNAEKEILGFTHAQIGQLLAERWNLPSKLTEIIALHHSPEQSAVFAKETAVIHLADILCRSLEMGFGGDHFIPELNHFAWQNLNLKKSAITSIMEEMEKEFFNLKTLFEY